MSDFIGRTASALHLRHGWARLASVLVAGVLLTASALIAGCDGGAADRSWTLVWEDDFNGQEGQSPDATKWGFDIGTDWGNAQLEYDTDRPENASLDGQGNLRITARAESYQGRSYTSARLVTRDLFERTYGRYEARMKLPWGAGMWPAFWLLGANYETVGWPETGEIDIMEYRGQEPSTVHGTVHGPGYSAGNGITKSYSLAADRFDTGFHVFAVEWGPDYIDWFVDGIPYHSVSREDLGDNPWVFDHDFYIILNLAVGGSYVGPPAPNTRFPQEMLVDWVRVYEEKP